MFQPIDHPDHIVFKNRNFKSRKHKHEAISQQEEGLYMKKIIIAINYIHIDVLAGTIK